MSLRCVPRFLLLLLVVWSCDDSPQESSVAEQTAVSPAPVFLLRPAVRHDNFYGEQDESGVKLMRPEILAGVLFNSFGVAPTVTTGDGAEVNPFDPRLSS